MFAYKQFFKEAPSYLGDYCSQCFDANPTYKHMENETMLCDVCFNKLNDIPKTSFSDRMEIDYIYTHSFGLKIPPPRCFMCNEILPYDYCGTEWGYKCWYYGYKLSNRELNICDTCYNKLGN